MINEEIGFFFTILCQSLLDKFLGFKVKQNTMEMEIYDRGCLIHDRQGKTGRNDI